MRLWSYWRSSASYRVRIGLGLKGLTPEYVPVSLIDGGGQQHAADFVSMNPMHQVPMLEVEDGGKKVLLTQSVAILEYLDERWPEPPLLPAEPLARAIVRRAVEIVNSGIQPLQNLGVLDTIKKLGGDPAAFARAANERGLASLEALAAEHGGLYLVGDSVTMADVFLVPQLFGARRFGVALDAFPRLASIEQRLASLPAFAAAHPERQPDAPRTE